MFGRKASVGPSSHNAHPTINQPLSSVSQHRQNLSPQKLESGRVSDSEHDGNRQDTPRVSTYFHLNTLQNLPPETRDKLAWWVTHVVIGIAFTAYLSVLLSQVVTAYQNPFITISLVEHDFPLPGMFVCGHCLESDSPESCGEASCYMSTHADPNHSADPVERCDDFIVPLLSEHDPDFRNFPGFVQDYLDHKYAGNCLLLRPPTGRTFKKMERVEKMFLKIEYPEDIVESHREEDQREYPLGFTVFDASGYHGNHSAEPTEVDTGVVHAKITRTHLETVMGGHEYSLELKHHGIQDKTANSLTFEILPSTSSLTDKVENSRYTWSQLLGNASAALGLARMIAIFLLGRAALSPWGWIHRWVTRTSPSSLGRKAGLEVPKDVNPLMTDQRRRTMRAEMIENRPASPALSESVPLNYRSSPLLAATNPAHSPRLIVTSMNRFGVEESNGLGEGSLPRISMPAARLSGASSHHSLQDTATLGHSQSQHSLLQQSIHAITMSPSFGGKKDSLPRPSFGSCDRREGPMPPPYHFTAPTPPQSQPQQHSMLLQGTSSRSQVSSTHVVELQFLMHRVAALELTLAKYYAADLETAIDVEMLGATSKSV